jgi:HAD superfamily hydrolase (TIGR01509 family)
MKNLQAVIFDLDGVIIDSEPIHARAKRIAFSRFGMEVPNEVYERFVGETDWNVVEYVVTHYGDDSLRIQDVLDLKQSEFRSLIPDMESIPGALEFIENARDAFEQLVLVTSATPLNEKLSLEQFGLDNTFDFTIYVDDVAHAKPHPEPYNRAIEKLALPAESCFIIEDSINGVTAAAASGAFVAGMQTSMSEEQLLDAGADIVFPDFQALSDWLFKQD